MTGSGMDQGDERKRTIDEASKSIGWCQNWWSYRLPGSAQKKPAYCLCGTRRKGGMNLIQALVRNAGTYCVMLRENPISGGPTKGESIDACSRVGPSHSSDEGP